MVNFVEAAQSLLHLLAKMAGLRQQMVEIEPKNTLINFWIPKDHDPNRKLKKENMKPAVVLIHGFTANGIMTWYFQAQALCAANYSVYVPDLLFFGKSTTESKERSPKFQAECFLRALDKLGVEKCSVVGFSYGGIVALKMAELRPSMVQSLILTGTVTEMTESRKKEILNNVGCSSFAQLLLPENVDGVRRLISVGFYRIRLIDFLYRDYLEVMFDNRKEREEILNGMLISDSDYNLPTLTLKMLLLWGENEGIFTFEQAKNTLMELGETATLQGISKARHVVHIERPFVYNRRMKEFLSLVHSTQGNASRDASHQITASVSHMSEGDVEGR